MAIFNWNSSYQTGNEEIDRQHKKLVDMLNQLDESISIEGSHNTALKVLNELADYTHYHFATEEKFMQSHQYDTDQFAKHKGEHDQFIEQVKTALDDIQDNPDKLEAQLLDFLVQWLMNHILLTDKKMVGQILEPEKKDNDQAINIEILNSNLYGALRESENRFKELADILPASIWINNQDGKRIFVNQHYLKLTNLTQAECLEGNWQNSIYPDDLNRLREIYRKAQQEHNTEQVEYRIQDDQGNIFWILETIIPRQRSNQQFSGFMGCGIDISKQKMVEKSLEDIVEKRTQQLLKTNQKLQREKEEQLLLNSQLKETQSHLVQSEKMASIGQLAAGVAHEINNPLGYINSNLSSLRNYLADLDKVIALTEKLTQELPDDNAVAKEYNTLKDELDLEFVREDLKDLVEESIEGANRAKNIVQDLRDFSRIDKKDRAIFDLENGLDATLNIVHNELKYKADIMKEYGGVEPFECVGAQLNQVFMNLLVNAAHAIEEFGVITVRTGYKDDDWVWVEVEDTGKGISEEIKNKIFDPFFTTKPVGKGTGLGLSLSYKIIQDHQGYFEIDSEIGVGTKFRVYIPVK